jgi:hypothetical protein
VLSNDRSCNIYSLEVEAHRQEFRIHIFWERKHAINTSHPFANRQGQRFWNSKYVYYLMARLVCDVFKNI